MRIAFDVKGTIDGPFQDLVLRLLEEFQKQGHEIIVWSNSYYFATEAVKKHGLLAEARSKKMKMDVDYDEEQYMDIAIEDDTRQDWLASKRFIWVKDLPDTIEGIVNLANELGPKK